MFAKINKYKFLMLQLTRFTKYQRRLFINFTLLFVVFSVVVGVFQYQREKTARIHVLEAKLETYIDLTYRYLQDEGVFESGHYAKMKQLAQHFPSSEVRLTLINKEGVVLYDSFVEDHAQMENHSTRPELQQALNRGSGTSIRLSASTNTEFYYYAEKFDQLYIRTALPYDVSVANALKADLLFLYVIVLLFAFATIMLLYISDRFGKSLIQLQEFAKKAAKGERIDLDYNFPKNELGSIGDQIVKVYYRVKKAKDELNAEREKLYRHLQISHEGIAIFSKEGKSLLANNHFIQYLNSISDETVASPKKFFTLNELKPIVDFVDNRMKHKDKQDNAMSDILSFEKNGRYYVVQAIVFDDLSFEISINDVSKQEKRKILKQEMTSNIAHELKTPVSSILGYLETILTIDMPEEKRKFFLERSYVQSQRLASLIQDISLLNKIEEASDLFALETLNVNEIVNFALDDLRLNMEAKNITANIELSKTIEIQGNRSVFYSIWRNLIENAINYAGEEVTISIKDYLEDDEFVYFSFSDNGRGVAEEHLTRIFERFYRVDSGRARTMGGTGLGLAIVKNGVVFHKGEISVKNHKDGGLEYIFSICKRLSHKN